MRGDATGVVDADIGAEMLIAVGDNRPIGYSRNRQPAGPDGRHNKTVATLPGIASQPARNPLTRTCLVIVRGMVTRCLARTHRSRVPE
jgi:hypothetical protein